MAFSMQTLSGTASCALSGVCASPIFSLTKERDDVERRDDADELAAEAKARARVRRDDASRAVVIFVASRVSA